MIMIKRLYRHAAFVLVPAALLAAMFEWRKTPLSIILGGIIALLNIKGLAWGVEGMLESYKAAAKLIFWSFTRLIAVVAVIVALAVAGLVNIMGVFIGLILVFTLLLFEGMKETKDM